MDEDQEFSKRKAAGEVAACPYAKVLKANNSKVGNTSTSLPVLAELKACPAFSNRECPFKGLPSDQVAEKLKDIPPSHLEKNGTFHKTLEFFHHNNDLKQSVECPVKNSLPADWSFDQAMEEYSLASVMGRLAQEYENSQKQELNTSSSSDEEGSTNSAALAMPPTLLPDGTRRLRLAEALKDGTAVAHEAAESVHFVKNFIRGKIDRNLYGLLVAQLFHIYTKLEDALDVCAPEHFSKCHFPKELRRTSTLQEDVDFWHTSSNPSISPATQDYIDRIDYLAAHKPLLLLSHAYTRYMGDLSGGKVLARVARKALNLSKDDAGLAFYHFEHINSFKLFKDHYRTSLNALLLTNEQILDLVQEANVAFLLNMRLFEELDVLDNVPGATVRSLEEVYHLSKKASSVTGEDASQCPFISKQKVNTAFTEDDAQSQEKKRTCPWPFILLHDPKNGMKHWQTWVVIGIASAAFYKAML